MNDERPVLLLVETAAELTANVASLGFDLKALMVEALWGIASTS